MLLLASVSELSASNKWPILSAIILDEVRGGLKEVVGPPVGGGAPAFGQKAKRLRIAETVLNNTQDRDTAILQLIKADEVGNKPSNPHRCPRTKGTEAEEKAKAAGEEREDCQPQRDRK